MPVLTAATTIIAAPPLLATVDTTEMTGEGQGLKTGMFWALGGKFFLSKFYCYYMPILMAATTIIAAPPLLATVDTTEMTGEGQGLKSSMIWALRGKFFLSKFYCYYILLMNILRLTTHPPLIHHDAFNGWQWWQKKKRAWDVSDVSWVQVSFFFDSFFTLIMTF